MTRSRGPTRSPWRRMRQRHRLTCWRTTRTWKETGVRGERREHPPGRPDPCRAQRGRTADGRHRHRPRLAPPCGPGRRHRSGDRRHGRLPRPECPEPRDPRAGTSPMTAGIQADRPTAVDSSHPSSTRSVAMYTNKRSAQSSRSSIPGGSLMTRLLAVATAMVLSLLIIVPVTLAADPSPGGEQVVITSGADITLPAAQTVDLFIVYDGTARIEGHASTIMIVNGAANVVGGSADGVIAIESQVTLDDG